MPSPLAPSSRILCLTLRSGSVGHAVLDGFGVAEHSFFTSRVDHLAPARRFRRLVRLVRESCRRFHPTRIVLGLPGPLQVKRMAFAERLARRFASLGLPVSVQRFRDAAALFVERLRYDMPDELIARLAGHFELDVTPVVTREHPRAWYWRPAWYALAVALAALIEHHPHVAAALARSSAFEIGPFRDALAASLARVPRPV